MRLILIRMKILFYTFAFVAVLTTAAFPQENTKLVVALKPDKNPDAMLEKQKELSSYLSNELHIPVEVIVPLSAAVILEGLSNGSIDIGYLSATDMVNAQEANAADLLLAEEINGKTIYESYWLVRKDSTYKSIKDLHDKPIAFASRSSTSGYLIPMLDLKKRGLLDPKNDPESFFGKGNVWFGTGYASAAARVLAGEAEAAAVSDYVFNTNKYLSADERSRLRVLQSQGPVPTHVLAVSTKLPDAEQNALKQAFTKLNLDDNRKLRESVFNAEFVEVNPATHLEPIIEGLKIIAR